MMSTRQALRLAPGETMNCPACGEPMGNQQRVYVPIDSAVDDVPKEWTPDVWVRHTAPPFCSSECIKSWYGDTQWLDDWTHFGWAQQDQEREYDRGRAAV